jgi:hypothetical protein
MTVRGRSKETQRDRLVIERNAGKDYTTLRAIADMRMLCRVTQPVSSRAGESAEAAHHRTLAMLASLRVAK